MYITICETDHQSKFDETGHAEPVHWDNPEGWDREGGGGGLGWGGRLGGFGMRDMCTPVADSCQCMAETATIL